MRICKVQSRDGQVFKDKHKNKVSKSLQSKQWKEKLSLTLDHEHSINQLSASTGYVCFFPPFLVSCIMHRTVAYLQSKSHHSWHLKNRWAQFPHTHTHVKLMDVDEVWQCLNCKKKMLICWGITKNYRMFVYCIWMCWCIWYYIQYMR